MTTENDQPFLHTDTDTMVRLQAAMRDLLKLSEEHAAAAFKERPQIPAGDGGNIIHRTAVGTIVQMLWNAATARGEGFDYSAFNVLDGYAQGMAVFLAQAKDNEGSERAYNLIVDQTLGYMRRYQETFGFTSKTTGGRA